MANPSEKSRKLNGEFTLRTINSFPFYLIDVNFAGMQTNGKKVFRKSGLT
jgi:hypothetical protein